MVEEVYKVSFPKFDGVPNWGCNFVSFFGLSLLDYVVTHNMEIEPLRTAILMAESPTRRKTDLRHQIVRVNSNSETTENASARRRGSSHGWTTQSPSLGSPQARGYLPSSGRHT